LVLIERVVGHFQRKTKENIVSQLHSAGGGRLEMGDLDSLATTCRTQRACVWDESMPVSSLRCWCAHKLYSVVVTTRFVCN